MASLGPRCRPRDPHPPSRMSSEHQAIPSPQPGRLGTHQALHPVLGGLSRLPSRFPAPGLRRPLTASPAALRPRRAGRPRCAREVPSELSFSLKTNAFSPPETPRQPPTPTALAAGQVPEKRQQSHGTSASRAGAPGAAAAASSSSSSGAARTPRSAAREAEGARQQRRRDSGSSSGPGPAGQGRVPRRGPRPAPRAGLARRRRRRRRRMELLAQTRPTPPPSSPYAPRV